MGKTKKSKSEKFAKVAVTPGEQVSEPKVEPKAEPKEKNGGLESLLDKAVQPCANWEVREHLLNGHILASLHLRRSVSEHQGNRNSRLRF